jgi:hypothetical protein
MHVPQGDRINQLQCFDCRLLGHDSTSTGWNLPTLCRKELPQKNVQFEIIKNTTWYKLRLKVVLSFNVKSWFLTQKNERKIRVSVMKLKIISDM